MVGTWQKAKIPPYKHAMAGFPSQITYGGGWQKKPPRHSAMAPPWPLYNNTALDKLRVEIKKLQ